MLKEFNITLNIKDAYLNPKSIRIDSKKLFFLYCLISTALFWGNYNLQIINPSDVVSIRGIASNLESVALFCVIKLMYLKMRVIKSAY